MVDLLQQSFKHFACMDEANAAIHCSPVKYSPITFRLASALEYNKATLNSEDSVLEVLIAKVLTHEGKYDLDSGR